MANIEAGPIYKTKKFGLIFQDKFLMNLPQYLSDTSKTCISNKHSYFTAKTSRNYRGDIRLPRLLKLGRK
jgi:hypothetical protein